MPSSLKLRLSARARQDVRAILQYTFRRWGQKQHDAYANRLDRAMQDLTEFPESGRERHDLRRGLRSRAVAEHVIVYRVRADEVFTVRIVHGTRDLGRQLGR
jgi:toxin ParE1/3/4